jgi:hypothetical protein
MNTSTTTHSVTVTETKLNSNHLKKHTTQFDQPEDAKTVFLHIVATLTLQSVKDNKSKLHTTVTLTKDHHADQRTDSVVIQEHKF